MKAVLMSIQPRWCELIASGKKTVEVRKTKPKLETPFKVYIYCTKDEPLYRSGEKFICPNKDFGNGKVIGEFVCDKIDKIFQCNSGWVQEHACISREEYFKYLGLPYNSHFDSKGAYAWHISDLVIYDKPRDLRSFYRPRTAEEIEADIAVAILTCGIHGSPYAIKKPPQSWCYVERSESLNTRLLREENARLRGEHDGTV